MTTHTNLFHMIEVIIEHRPNDTHPDKFYVFSRDSFLSFFHGWKEIGRYPNRPAAEEFALSRGASVKYLGCVQNDGWRFARNHL